MFIFKDLYKNSIWWYWLATIPLLAMGVAGQVEAIYLAMVLTVIQFVHYRIADEKISFRVQVRAYYLGLLVMGLWAPLFWIHWVQLIGTTAMVLFGYCTLARLSSLLPWNRTAVLNWDLVKRTFFSAPVRGNILQGLPNK
ncbi:MAG: hypothetical protein OEY67_06590 [Gammaproteobacteria bacterium]|nr:hypothetical protein [Gammaproteobacteria bacterium]